VFLSAVWWRWPGTDGAERKGRGKWQQYVQQSEERRGGCEAEERRIWAGKIRETRGGREEDTESG
jgi:hypothetical protein